jgi:hypothetical protein
MKSIVHYLALKLSSFLCQSKVRGDFSQRCDTTNTIEMHTPALQVSCLGNRITSKGWGEKLIKLNFVNYATKIKN